MCWRLAGCRKLVEWIVLVLLLVQSGCAFEGSKLFSSKWASGNARYAEQYSEPYSDQKVRKWSRMAQQMADARFLEGTSGFYASAGGATTNRAAAGGEIGVFTLPTSWSTVRVGAVGLVAENIPTFLTGAVVGGRIHAPTRVSPYVGLSGMFGYGRTQAQADHSYVDGDGKIVLKGQSIPGQGVGIAAIVPEAGLSWWVTSKTRANLGASYYITTDGRDQDFLLLGLSLDWDPTGVGEKPESKVHVPDAELEKVLQSQKYFHEEPDEAAPM